MCIDRKSQPGEPVQCAEFIPLPLSPYANAPGVSVQRIEQMETVLPSGSVETSDFPGLMVDRAAFDAALARRAEQQGAALHWGCRLEQLRAHERIAELQQGAQRLSVGYRLLVAADGPHSPVAAALGLPPLTTVHTRQYSVPLTRSLNSTWIWLSDRYPGGYGWLFPKGRVANLGLGMDKRFGTDLKGPLEALHASLVADGRVGAELLGRTGGAIPVGGLRRSLVEGDVLFAGDAGGFTHPISGAGIAAAVISGEAAGLAAAAALDGEPGALAEYDEEMREQFGPSLTRAVMRRTEMVSGWCTSAALEDEWMRRGWIAFDDYYAAPVGEVSMEARG